MSDIILTEFRSTGQTRHHGTTPEKFLAKVDEIRKRKNGWQLELNGLIIDEKTAFGKTVCYGVYAPSKFN